MITNDILRRLRYALDLPDAQVQSLIALEGHSVSRDELTAFLTREGEPGFLFCPDHVLRAFLDGLILMRRGPPDPNAPRPREDGRLDNNVILRKLKIALELREQAMLDLLKLGGMTVSASELSALFRRPGHPHYRPCGDQLLRNLLAGLAIQHRGSTPRA